jgi:hypothetical protein
MASHRGREYAVELLADLSREILGDDAAWGESSFRSAQGYHIGSLDRRLAADRFRDHATAVLDKIVAALPDLSGELAEGMLENDERFFGTLRELSWIIAYSRDIIADVRLTTRFNDVVPASPALFVVQNLDPRPLKLTVYKLDDSFEAATALDIGAAESAILRTGEKRFFDGFREVVSYEEDGILIAVVSTSPLGAYDALFCPHSGARLGLFSTDIGLSSCVVALRIFALAGWSGATDVAGSASSHALKEVRWAALNYFWRTSPADLESRLEAFAADPDPEISQLARHCIATLAAEERMAG